MSEILTLAETFKKKSQKQAESIEQEIANVLTRLNESMTQNLQSSERIIRNGTESLREQSEKLQQTIDQHHKSIDTLTQDLIRQSQAHTERAIEQSERQTRQMLDAYTQSVQNLMSEKESQTYEAIKSNATAWLIGLSVAVVTLLMIGMLLGIMLAKHYIKPQVIYYVDVEPQKTQTYQLPQG